MNKLLITLSVVLVLGIIGAVGFFGYNKYQEVELEKKKLEVQLKEESEDDDSTRDTLETKSDNTENIGQTTNNKPETQATDGSETVKVHEGSSKRIASKEEFAHLKVNRDNVFDYLIAAINQSEGGDASKITFQQPEFSAQGDGIWRIPANNKSGHGSYTFLVEQDGTVSFLDGMMDKFHEEHVTLP